MDNNWVTSWLEILKISPFLKPLESKYKPNTKLKSKPNMKIIKKSRKESQIERNKIAAILLLLKQIK